MFDINHIAILVAAIVTLAVATIWYAPSVFGRPWMRAVGIDESEAASGMKGMWKRMLIALAIQYVILYVLTHFLLLAEAYEGTSGLFAAAWAALLVVAVMASNVLWEKRPLSYLFITAGYTLVTFVGGGTIILYWPW